MEESHVMSDVIEDQEGGDGKSDVLWLTQTI